MALLAGLLGLLALLSLLSPIAAQSATTLVSNAGQDSDSKHTDGRERSQAFTTGDSGATLSRVEIISEDTDFDDAAVSLCTVDGSNHPTSSCTPLTAPSRFLPGTLVFTAPADTTLEANTTYSVLIESPGKQSLLLDATPSDDEDDGRARNWTIDNTFYQKNYLDEWVAYPGPGVARSLRITIKGTLTNNAPTVATAILDQTVTTGAAFTYAFPAATFTDADSDTLSYAAAKSDDTALPSWLSFDPATRTFSGTPQTADVGTVSVKVTASDGSDSVSDTFDIVVSEPPDTTSPRVASIVRQNPTSSPTNADSLTWRVTFSEAVSNVDAADFAVRGTTATVTAVATVSGVTGAYDVTTSGGDLAGVSATVTLAIASSHNIQDAASNALSNTAPTGTNDNSYVVDNTAPTVTISSVPATSTELFLPKFTFSEAVTGFAVGDITLGNATASSFTTATSKTAYWVVVTPTAAGTVTVDVSANAAQDAAGNGNTAATRASSTFTLPVITLPAITITAGTSPVTEGTSAVFTLSRTLSTTAELAVNVTVSETGGDMVAAANEGARTVTFLANSTTATLSVTTAPDSVDEANSVVTATVSAAGSPASYSVGTPASAMVTVQDDDTRRVTVSATALPVNEGSTGTYTVVLNSQPTASVTVTPSRTGSADVTFSPPTLTFTTSNWSTVRPVTVTAAQDSDAVDDSATISHAVTGGDYAGVTADSVVVTVDDDETADTTSPRVASIVRQNPTSSPTNADSLTWRVTFSEAVSNVDTADFAVRGTTATVTAVATVSGVTGAYDVTASGGNLAGVSATVTLAIASSQNIKDAASNALSNTSPRGTNDNSYVVDNTAPTVTISGVPATSDAPFTATFTFSEAVTGFAVGDITLGNGAASSFTVTSTTVYTALVTPTAAGTVTVDVSANAARDAVGNGNTAATRASSTFTLPVITLPAITITAGTSPLTEGTSAVFTLSRTGSTTAALTVNVTVSETGGDMVAAADEGARTVTFQTNSTTATLSVATAPDSVDEANGVVTATVAADTGSPASYSVGTPASAAVTVQDNDTRRVTVSATALPVNEGSMGTYTVVLNSQPTASVTVTPSRTGSTDVTFSPPTLTFTTSNWSTVRPVTVRAAQDSDAVDDSATISHAVTGGDYAGVTVESVVVTVDDDETADTTSPRVASIVRQNPTSSPTNADSLTWRVTFSEAVSNVDATDFAVRGTTATVTAVATVSGVTGAYDVTASGGNLASVSSATVTLAIASSQNIKDAASNALSNTSPRGTNDNSYVVDNTAPTVTISGVPATSDAPFTATFTFSEAVTGFAVGDITLGNATASSFTTSPSKTVYRALVTPTAAGTVTVDVTANAARDAAGNGNTAATRASSTYTGTASLPTITITASTSPVAEGTPAVFTLSRTGSTTAELAVNVTVSETGGDMVAAADEGARTVTFLANSATATLSVATAPDSVDEANGVVTATVSAAGSPASYSVGTPASAMVTVQDNDTTRPVITTGGGGGGGGGGGPPPKPIPSDEDFDWNVTRDIESLDRDNDLPTGIWSNGETLWVIENSASGTDRVFAYDLLTGEHKPDAEFELDRRNRFSHGIWSDGETVWVADSGQDQLFAYDLATGERLEEREFELAERNRDPRGIWSDGEVMYVLDGVKRALFVYDFETGELVAEYPFDKLNQSPRGIWSDGVTLWVSDDGANRLFAYEVDGEALTRNEDLEFTFRSLLKAGNGSPRGIWSDGDIMYVVDEQDHYVYTYNIPDAIIAQLASLSLNELELEEFSPRRFEYAASVAYDLAATTVAAVATQETAKVMIAPADADGDPANGHQITLGTETAITVTVTSADGSRKKTYVIQVSKPPCLSGLTEDGFSEVTFVGGTVSDLEACARSFDISALYHLREGVYVALFLLPELPEFLSRPFRSRFAEGLPPGESLIANRQVAVETAPGTPSSN